MNAGKHAGGFGGFWWLERVFFTTLRSSRANAGKLARGFGGCVGVWGVWVCGWLRTAPYSIHLQPPKPSASLPALARELLELVKKRAENDHFRTPKCKGTEWMRVWILRFRGGIKLARAPYHPRPIGVGPHPQWSHTQKDY